MDMPYPLILVYAVLKYSYTCRGRAGSEPEEVAASTNVKSSAKNVKRTNRSVR
jgi:hypothetical protein